MKEFDTTAGLLIISVTGAGKSTLAIALATQLSADHLAASTVLRDYARSNPEVASSLQEYWSRGMNAPDELVEPALWDAYTRCRSGTFSRCRHGANTPADRISFY